MKVENIFPGFPAEEVLLIVLAKIQTPLNSVAGSFLEIETSLVVLISIQKIIDIKPIIY
jgi:hypothetical protein